MDWWARLCTCRRKLSPMTRPTLLSISGASRWCCTNPSRGATRCAAPTLQETLECISNAVVPDLRELVPECPESVAAFFHDALARDRARRPGSEGELKSRLGRALNPKT